MISETLFRSECFGSAVHEAGHAWHMLLNPTYRSYFGTYIRIFVLGPGVAFCEGQRIPFDGPSRWLPLTADVPGIDRELMLARCYPALAQLAAENCLAGFAAEFADKNELPDADLPYVLYPDLVLSPDFKRGVALKERIDHPEADGRFNVVNYHDARKWCCEELCRQITALHGEPIARIRKCALKLLEKPDCSLLWQEAESVFKEETTNTPPATVSPDALAVHAESLNTFRQNSEPVKRRASFARRFFAMLSRRHQQEKRKETEK